jgi:glycine betaine/proline transport system substrate-binding protein
MKVTGALSRTGLGIATLALALVATSCGGGDDEGDGSSGDGGGGTVTMGIIPSWTDSLSTAYLLKDQLEDQGYTVEITELSEAAPLYAGLAQGDIDIYPSAWPEVTHAAYMDQYGDRLEDLGTYYDNAKLTFAVPDYVDVQSIADLPSHAAEFDGKVVGIEPGAGLTRVTKESVFPAYGLDEDFTLVESSTTAMLAELQRAVDNQDPIVVTLWRPFWANSTFPVRDLEDPEGALGEPEKLHVLATGGFSDEFPDVAEMLGNFKLDDEQFGSLENLVVNEYGQGKEAEAVTAWLEENPDWPDTLTG